MSELTQKNEEDSMSANLFYLSIYWNMFACEKYNLKGGDTKCVWKPRDDLSVLCADKSRINYVCHNEC